MDEGAVVAFLLVVGTLASMVTDAGAGPHVVHGPDDGLARGENLLDVLQREHPLVYPVQMDDVCCWNSGSEVMSVPVLAMSTAKMFFLLKRLALQMTMRSQTNFHTMRQLWSSDTTEIWSVCLSRTSSLALMRGS